MSDPRVAAARFMSSSAVAYCHNGHCASQLVHDGVIRLAQEWDTGAWVPEACPACGEDLHDNPWAAPTEFTSEGQA